VSAFAGVSSLRAAVPAALAGMSVASLLRLQISRATRRVKACHPKIQRTKLRISHCLEPLHCILPKLNRELVLSSSCDLGLNLFYYPHFRWGLRGSFFQGLLFAVLLNYRTSSIRPLSLLGDPSSSETPLTKNIIRKKGKNVRAQGASSAPQGTCGEH
jgi:hypothetical protein